jgi:hypothetical protein
MFKAIIIVPNALSIPKELDYGKKRNKRHTKNIIGGTPLIRLPFIIIGICCVIVLAIVIITSRAPTANSYKSVISWSKPKSYSCTTHCQNSATSWVHLRSETPPDVISAVKQTDMYQIFVDMGNRLASHHISPQNADSSARLFIQSTLGTPILVKPYRDDAGSPTYWVVPLLNSAKQTVMMLTFTYDPLNHRLQASNFEGGDDFTATHPFPSVSQIAAVTLVQQMEHISVVLKGSKAPVLVYFEFNPFVVSRADLVRWTGGGTENIDPIWRIVTTNGHYYYVDHLGKRVYTGKSLPIDPSYPSAL